MAHDLYPRAVGEAVERNLQRLLRNAWNALSREDAKLESSDFCAALLMAAATIIAEDLPDGVPPDRFIQAHLTVFHACLRRRLDARASRATTSFTPEGPNAA